MKILMLGLGLLGFFGCSSEKSDKKDKMDMTDVQQPGEDAMGQMPLFPAEYLSAFSSWTPVLNGDQAFKSAGHGGIIVRTYMNDIAAKHAMENEVPFPLPEGAVLAKAVVSTMDAMADTASRVYFMKKQASGYDSEHGDWSYGLANRVNGSLVYDTSLSPKADLCVSCHVKFSEYDYVQTVSFFKNQSVMAN